MTSQKRRFAGSEHETGHEHSAAELDAMRQALDERLGHLLAAEGDRNDRLAAAMRAAVLGSGKRMRPLLLMLVAADLDCASPAVTDVACAVEIVHAASLILDDMPCMDNATLRRGQPTIHRQFGEDVAILASVALLSRAFGILASAPGIPPATRARLVATLADTVGAQGLVRGQFEDLHGGTGRTAEAIATTNERKTGLLLGAAVDMAAVLAEVDDCKARSLRDFALAAGHAFQIRDDFQDLPGADSAVTGKDTGLDLGKATLINTFGADEAQRRLADHLREVERHLGDALAGAQRTRRFVQRMFAAQPPQPRQPARPHRYASSAINGTAQAGFDSRAG
ncbi:polyprenyl synthetase family protein [Pseudoduganella umbonata]|uniref:Geranylgeranyl diphosphate synthase type II n=1 Tax=Pseudoduganella umbonata TaxID=864828 RepID=A0A4P8HXC6_9BURK|nr:polyprenyl synthetase family protein [Pseudoduganella umbonata]MBB3222993.1 geranylgeranyl diphosphate synthase type II [Pseudoduganella umbonata]QCP13105.1 polyprenyl synthetase family protein [Pseudoduganella umbonata]